MLGLLRLTLVKAERRLWVAPWPELRPQMIAQAQRRNLPSRHELLGSGYGDGWQTSQHRDSWTVVLPIKEGSVDADDVRVAVAADAFNLHLVGQEEMPLLAGELHGRVLPDQILVEGAARLRRRRCHAGDGGCCDAPQGRARQLGRPHQDVVHLTIEHRRLGSTTSTERWRARFVL